MQPRKTSTLSRSCTTSVSGTKRTLGVRPLPQISHGALVDGGWHVGEPGLDRRQDRSVVGHLVHRRHVHALDLGEVAQHRVAIGAPAANPGADDLGDLADDLFALTQHHEIDEVGQRLGVERGVTADDHQRVLRSAVLGPDRHPGQVDHLEHVGEDQLRRQVEGQQVELACGPVGVDREQRDLVAGEERIEIGPGRVRALGDGIAPLVQDLVEDLQPLVGQADLVRVGVGEQPRHLPRGVAGRDGTVLATDVSSRFLHQAQERFDPRPEFGHDPTSLASPTPDGRGRRARRPARVASLLRSGLVPSPLRPLKSSPRPEGPLDWYKDAVIYELHVRAFADSNGDGIGDFTGLSHRLDYLADLGVTAIWLLPFYPSPLRDDGYDIADYDRVNPDYGDIRAFQRFLAAAHERGIRVITELVVNHTSDQHPWFQRARRAPAGSPERDFYVWSDRADRYADARIIFQDFETSNWTWDAEAGAYFWHRFYSHQPDLNYENPAVEQAVIEVLDFWLGMGVDGLRLDAVPYLYEEEGTTCENLPETHAALKRLRAHMDRVHPGTMLLAEANQWPEDAAAYFGDGDECHMNFHFPVMPRLFMALRQEQRTPIIDIMEQTPEPPGDAQWAMFLRNHDELTLEMVTDEERDLMLRAYASDRQMRINLGIRRRLAPLLDNDRRTIELLNALLFSLPGHPGPLLRRRDRDG